MENNKPQTVRSFIRKIYQMQRAVATLASHGINIKTIAAYGPAITEVSGNTFQIKTGLLNQHGQWMPGKKVWLFNAAKFDACKLVRYLKR